MRAHVLAGVTFGIAAGFVASAVALAQTPFAFPIMTTPIVLDAGPPIPSAIDAGTTDDASSTDAAPPIDAAPELAIPVPPPPPPPPPPEDADAGYTPSDVGFSVGLRVGYSVPLGSAKDVPVSSLVQGMVPIGVDVGWFFNPHFYVGGYFLYGIATGIEASNGGVCNDPDESCSANMFRMGVVAHYHFRPEAQLDPWLGGGIGYDIVNFQAQDTSLGTVDQSASLHGFDLTLDTGLDYKPLPYVGMGPFAELAAGHYNSETSSTALHEWLTFGLRLRTNL